VPDADDHVRLAAFRFLQHQSGVFGGTLPWRALSTGFVHEGRRLPLVGPQGIFRPAGMRLPLSITTAPLLPGKERPYFRVFLAPCFWMTNSPNATPRSIPLPVPENARETVPLVTTCAADDLTIPAWTSAEA